MSFSFIYVLKNWQATDHPWFEHFRHSPDCSVVKSYLPENKQDIIKALGIEDC